MECSPRVAHEVWVEMLRVLSRAIDWFRSNMHVRAWLNSNAMFLKTLIEKK